MPVYLFTIHSYRSWMPDRPQGYVLRGKGIQQPNEVLSRAYSQDATEAEFRFGTREQHVLLWILWDCCGRRGWRLHGVACEPTHIHAMLSWKDETPMREVFRKTKNLMSRELGLQCTSKRKHWFGKFGSKQRVKDERHFNHLMQNYLPKHKGLLWREGDSPPQRPVPSTSVDG